jgi:hypothetical protein
MTSVALVDRPIVSLRIRHELAKYAAQKGTVVPCEVVNGDVLSHLLDQRDWNLGQVNNLRRNRA